MLRALRSTAVQRAALRPLVSSRLVPVTMGARSFSSFLDRADVTDRVLGVVKSFEKVDPSKVTTKSHFVSDLGLDSLDTVEVVMAFEDEFTLEIEDKEAEKLQTCDDAINFVCAHPHAK
ncbi:mitochondrial acyl carrier protein [Pavlovales sp. CCMP2436]|nr:mitochondrial acyl carrier protein [Pavlovales sp. CCMP2436]